jgi:phenylacetic acid degradation operon negative regulatory protein
MKQLTSNEWIVHTLAADPPRSKSLVMTIFGDAIAPHGGSVWLGSLIELLAPFGVNDRLLRTSVFRLVQEDWLVASRDGRRSAYAILPQALARFRRAYRRIYSAPGLHWDGRWTLLLAPNGSVDTALRAALRKELMWEGYAMLGPGVLAHPAADAGSLGKLFVCSAAELPGAASRPLRELVEDGWDLSGVIASYRHFIDTFSPLLALLQHGDPITHEAAYVIRTLLIHAYRRVQLHDPRLPIELLPDPWPGSDAYQLASAIYRLTWAQAEQYLMPVLRQEDAQAPEVDAAFFERFGGLN